ncbi:PQQ-binding-like beta-propeller repeat protein [Halorubrum yunnanense]|uniref:PQQ-binding-like beta-propeller repeat protein n=1 Tax=Halorubrum yunnanense TaxID=1526162 RepID=A0ABD5YD38_9EURY|nr:PQQ-binding-like beta-propeller repeat protein [Halorubrum yunnanense]
MGVTTEWTTTVPDAGWIRAEGASDVGLVYVNTDNALRALDVSTGETAWTSEAENAFTSDDGTVYLTAGPTLWACDRDTGATRWEYVAPDPIDDVRRTETGRTYVECTDLGDDTGHVTAVSGDGTELWTRSTGYSGDLFTSDGKPYVVDTDENVHRLDPDTGGSVWSYGADRIFETVQDGTTLLFHGYDGIVALDLRTGDEVWSVPFSDYCWTFDIDDRSLYVGTNSSVTQENNTLRSIDLDTGRERWVAESEGWILGSFEMDGDTAYVGGEEGSIVAFSKRTGKERWQSTLGGEVWTIRVGRGIVFAGSKEDGEMGCAFDARSGERLWSLSSDPTDEWGVGIEFVADYVVQTRSEAFRALDPSDGALVLERPGGVTESHGDALFAVDEDEISAYSLADDVELFARDASGTEVFVDDDSGTDTRVFAGDDGDTRFCPRCGSSIDPDLDPSFCPECGAEL